MVTRVGMPDDRMRGGTPFDKSDPPQTLVGLLDASGSELLTGAESRILLNIQCGVVAPSLPATDNATLPARGWTLRQVPPRLHGPGICRKACRDRTSPGGPRRAASSRHFGAASTAPKYWHRFAQFGVVTGRGLHWGTAFRARAVTQ